jgi:hypothetical protein
LFYRLDFAPVMNVLSRGSLPLFVVGTIAFAATNPFNAQRWRATLAGQADVARWLEMREAALVVFLGALGIPGETALAASLCGRRG